MQYGKPEFNQSVKSKQSPVPEGINNVICNISLRTIKYTKKQAYCINFSIVYDSENFNSH